MERKWYQSYDKEVKKENQVITKGIEVGHIFYFSDKYSKPMNCLIDGKTGKKTSVKMGSYGIGVSRLVAATIEANYKNDVIFTYFHLTPLTKLFRS